MRVDKLRRRQRHPLIERHFGEVVAFEDFEKVEDAALAIPRDSLNIPRVLWRRGQGCQRRRHQRRARRRIGVLDPCASVEFSRGCPRNCSFCSAWTCYGRSYRLLSPEA
jgi:radical SAM superfamily enzyme YgiQ (UPF0313 family)